MIVKLIWPPSTLNPNARVHWSRRSRDTKSYRTYAKAQSRGLTAPEGPILFAMTFYPPNRRRRDDDGMVASMKAARDGIADALGIDDNRFRSTHKVMDPDPQGLGFVEVTLEPWGRQ